mgnify:CR=1 FL=1
MLISSILLAISTSIDSFGIGITYGVKNTKISLPAILILIIISMSITSLSLCFGNILLLILPDFILYFLGSFLLILMGVFIIFQSIYKPKKLKKKDYSKKTYHFFIESLGLTIQIIKDPISSDLDNSKNIDWKEALYLGIALSIDSFCIAISGTFLGINSFIFPIMVASFQIIFISFGKFIGKNFIKLLNISDNMCSILSGILLIFIGIAKFFC